jgi:hypothetical protein
MYRQRPALAKHLAAESNPWSFALPLQLPALQGSTPAELEFDADE